MTTNLIRIGCLATDSPLDVLSFCSYVQASKYSTLLLPYGTNYQVPAGYKLIIAKMAWCSPSAGVSLLIGYGDTTVTNSAVAPTNFVQLSNQDMFNPTALKPEFYDQVWIVPYSKYPCIIGGGGAGDRYFSAFGILMANP